MKLIYQRQNFLMIKKVAHELPLKVCLDTINVKGKALLFAGRDQKS